MPRSDRKMGGRSPLRVFVQGCPDLVDTVCSKEEGGRKLETGLVGLVLDAHAKSFRVEILRGASVRSDLLQDQLSAPGDETPDVVVLSLQLDITSSLGVEAFRDSLTRLIDSVKERWGAHVLLLGASSVDPDDHVHNYHGIDDTLVLRIHRFNLAALEVAVQTGISVVDTDRIIAELGGAQNVRKPFDFSPEAHRLLLRELHRVLGDIGFFEARPLMPQIGRA